MRASRPMDELSMYTKSFAPVVSRESHAVTLPPSSDPSKRNVTQGSSDGSSGSGCFSKSLSENALFEDEESSPEQRVRFPLRRCYNKSDTLCSEVNGVKVKLLNASLWSQFMEIGTEMILTKKGRRVFPVPSFLIEGLDSQKLYNIRLNIHPVDNKIHRFIGGAWTPLKGGTEYGSLHSVCRNNSFLHPSSPNTGDFWMSDPIVFGALKISNYIESHGMIVLQSMRKYRMTLVLKELGCTAELFFPQELTDFVAVTQYQNELVTRMKIKHNPFANAFRYADKRHKYKKEDIAGSHAEESDSQRHDPDVTSSSSHPSGLSEMPVLESTHSASPRYRHSSRESTHLLPHQRSDILSSNQNDLHQTPVNTGRSAHAQPDHRQWARHQNIDFQLIQAVRGQGDSSNANYGTRLPSADYVNADNPIKSLLQFQAGVSNYATPQSVYSIGYGDPLSEVRQLREFMQSTTDQIPYQDAISLVRKRHSNSHDEPLLKSDSDGGSPPKRLSSVNITGKIQKFPRENSEILDSNRSINNAERFESHLRDSDFDIEEVTCPKEETFDGDCENSCPEEIRQFSPEAPADMTVNHRAGSTSHGRQQIKRPEVLLKNRDLWCTTNEIVVSAEGRSMFPYISVSVSGLEPRRLYYMGLEITAASKWLHNYSGHEWRPCLATAAEERPVLYQHPENPKHDHQWAEGVLFDRLRLSTTRHGKNMLKVQLRRQYYPVLTIRTDAQLWKYALKDAMFITVSIDKTPLLLLHQGSPADCQEFEQDGSPSSQSTQQRKQKNPKKMKSSLADPYTMAMNVHDLNSNASTPYLPNDGATSVPYARALQAHDAGLLNEEEHQIYRLQQSPPKMYSPDIEHESRSGTGDMQNSHSHKKMNNFGSPNRKPAIEGAKDNHDLITAKSRGDSNDVLYGNSKDVL